MPNNFHLKAGNMSGLDGYYVQEFGLLTSNTFININSNWVFSKTIWRGKNRCSLMENQIGRIEFSITSLESGGNSELNGNVQIFFSINSNCVFSNTTLRKNARSPMEKGRIEFLITSLELGGNSEPNGNVQIFFYINSNCVFSKTIWKML